MTNMSDTKDSAAMHSVDPTNNNEEYVLNFEFVCQ